ncbi:PQQ-dependent sugar dehydrogenase [Halobaculum sp. MBLA0143]|uniref:PQQ-dependent sugar dehydrogenase n=1 Tax=Halobaculum sp. MBLA0143 TaxID=3079933 RepID=UPI003524DB11
MNRRQFLRLGAVAGLGTAAGCATGDGRGRPTATTRAPTDTAAGTATGDDHTPGAFDRRTAATGFAGPWAIEPLPDGRFLVTEKPGRLQLVDPAAGAVTEVPGTPEVFARGQGGLLDARLDPSYPTEPYLYLTYAARGDGDRSSTHVGRGRLDPEAPRLRGFELLHAAEPFVVSAGHYGSRIAFDRDRRLYVSVGDRQFKNFGPDHHAQRLDTELGAVLRLTADGDVPTDNPFRDDPDARDTIFSYGHRNVQGMTTRPETGRIWASEFGEQDGDEVNVLRRGANYGWPVADEGCTYGAGDPIGVSHADRADVVGPVVSWPCGSGGFPPSGTTFYDGDGFPEWRGDLFVSGLASRSLVRIAVDDGDDGPTARVAETLLADENRRIRDVAVAPDGSLLVARDGDPAPVVRLTPAQVVS